MTRRIGVTSGEVASPKSPTSQRPARAARRARPSGPAPSQRSPGEVAWGCGVTDSALLAEEERPRALPGGTSFLAPLGGGSGRSFERGSILGTRVIAFLPAHDEGDPPLDEEG